MSSSQKRGHNPADDRSTDSINSQKKTSGSQQLVLYRDESVVANGHKLLNEELLDPEIELDELGIVLYYLILAQIHTGLTFDAVCAWFATRYASFTQEASFINPQASRLVVAFANEADYNLALNAPPPFGIPHTPVGYDPTASPGNFFRLFFSCVSLSALSMQAIKEYFTAQDLRFTSITTNAAKNFVIVYVEDEEEWIKQLQVPFFYVTGEASHFFHNIVGLAATGDPSWVKLWISNLPKATLTKPLRSFLVKRLGVIPEVLTLYHEPATNRISNWGYIVSKTPEVINALLQAPEHLRTCKKGYPQEKIIWFAIAKSKRRAPVNKQNNV